MEFFGGGLLIPSNEIFCLLSSVEALFPFSGVSI
jgi:hypothetical protein